MRLTEQYKLAKEQLDQSQVVAFPTETVMGLGIYLDDRDAYDLLNKIKNRPEEKPYTLMLGDIKDIEKYAYQNASGYELFNDRWLTTTEMLQHMPIERADLEARLKAKNQIEVADSTKTYLLQVTEKHIRGEQMPIEYARPEIEKIVLTERQVEFLQKERERLYNEAIQSGKVIFYL